MGDVGTENDLPAWKCLLKESIVSPDALPWHSSSHPEKLKRVISRYPMRINPYYLGLIREKNDPLYRQCIPDVRELDDNGAVADPLNEEGRSPVYGLTHRYPDRVMFLVSSECAMYCRFCNRKRKVGRPAMVTDCVHRTRHRLYPGTRRSAGCAPLRRRSTAFGGRPFR